MNKSELIEAVAKAAELSKADAERALNATIDAVVKTVAKGDTVFVLDDLSTGQFQNIEHLKTVQTIVDTTLNQEIVRDLVREVDVVYHLAATVGVQLVVSKPIQTIVNNIRGNTICPFGDAVGMSIGAYLRQFPEEFIAHVEQGRCTYPAW